MLISLLEEESPVFIIIILVIIRILNTDAGTSSETVGSCALFFFIFHSSFFVYNQKYIIKPKNKSSRGNIQEIAVQGLLCPTPAKIYACAQL